MKSNKKALLVIFLTVFVDLVGFGIIIPLNPYLAKKFGADPLQVGLLMSVYSAFQFLFAPFWGHISDRYGRRPIILLSLFGAAISHLLFAFGGTLAMLFFARGLAGLFGANISTAMAYIADVTDTKSRSKGMGIVGAAFGLGFVLGPFLGGVMGHVGKQLGSQPPFAESFPALIASAICFVNFVSAFFFLHESLPVGRRAKVKKRPSRLGLIVKYGRRPQLGAVMLCFFLLAFGMANMEASLFLYVKDKFDWSLINASWGFAYVGLLIAFTQGYLIRKLLPKVGESKLILFGLIASGIGLFGVGLSDSVMFLAVAVSVMALGSGLANPSLSGTVSLLSDESEQGLVLGTNQSLASLARILGPALGGWLYQYLGMSSPFFAASGVCLVAMALILMQVKKLPVGARAVESHS